MSKKSFFKISSMLMALIIVFGTIILPFDNYVVAERVKFKKVGVTKLEYQVDNDGKWIPVNLKMKSKEKLKAPEVSPAAYNGQDIEIPKKYFGKSVKFRADFIDTTEENAKVKLADENCRIFNGDKKDVDTFKYTYEGSEDEEKEATYYLSSENVNGRDNALMTLNVNFVDKDVEVPGGGENGNKEQEKGLKEAVPTIKSTNINENRAVAGAVVATIEMPEGVKTEGVTFAFDESNKNDSAKKIRNMFVIKGNKICIIDNFDSYEFGDSALEFRTVSDRKYSDGKRHIKEDREFWLGVYGQKGDVKSQIGYTYEGNKSTLVIGHHEEEPIESNNQFVITKLEYYLGTKAQNKVEEKDWKEVDSGELKEVNATSGQMGVIAEGYVDIPSDITFKELNKANLYIRVSTDKGGTQIYRSDNAEPLIADVTKQGVKEKDGRTYGPISVYKGKGKDEIWRSFRIKVHPEVSEFTSYTYENVTVEAEKGILPNGTRLVVTPIVGKELEALKDKVGKSNLDSYVSAEDIKLVNYAGEEIAVPQGKEVTVKIKKPDKIEDKSVAVYHVYNEKVDKMDTTLDGESHIVFKTGSLSPFVIVARSTVGENDNDENGSVDNGNGTGDENGKDNPGNTDNSGNNGSGEANNDSHSDPIDGKSSGKDASVDRGADSVSVDGGSNKGSAPLSDEGNVNSQSSKAHTPFTGSMGDCLYMIYAVVAAACSIVVIRKGKTPQK